MVIIAQEISCESYKRWSWSYKLSKKLTGIMKILNFGDSGSTNKIVKKNKYVYPSSVVR